MAKKLTLEDLLDRKSKMDKMGISSIEVDGFGSLPVIKIKTRKIFEIIDKYDVERDKVTSRVDMMCELIYKSVPILQDKELLETLNVPTPYEVVEELFDFKEIEKIAEYIMALHGLSDDDTSTNEEIKN